MTGQTWASEPASALLASGIWYGLTHAVATLLMRAIFRPACTSASVMVGCSREWSIVLASWESVTVMVGAMVEDVFGGGWFEIGLKYSNSECD